MIINLSYLEDITGGDRAMILEMLDLFIRDIPEHIKNIETFAANDQIDDLAREAHKFKPTLQYIGLTGMFEDIKQLEANAKSRDNLDSVGEIISRLKDASQKCLPALKKKREELA